MRLFSFFKTLTTQVRAINEKYSEPKIAMTPFVKICLVSLRLYLILLVGLLVYKFIVAASQ